MRLSNKISSAMTPLLFKMLLWRERHVSERTFLIVLALVTGICCGFAALVLK